MGEIRFTAEDGKIDLVDTRDGIEIGFKPWRSASESERSVLFLDVDGVINVFDQFAAQSMKTREIQVSFGDGIQIPISFEPEIADRLRRLDAEFEIVWCTAWFEHANELLRAIAPDLGPWPVLSWSDLKLEAIQSEIRNGRGWVWIDDDADWEVERIGAQPPADSLILNTDPNLGLTEEVLDQALGFARSSEREA